MNEEEQLYDVFRRDWYYVDVRTGCKVPGPGPKIYLAHGATWSEAREICEDYNSTHEPGPLSHKAEFEKA